MQAIFTLFKMAGSDQKPGSPTAPEGAQEAPPVSPAAPEAAPKPKAPEAPPKPKGVPMNVEPDVYDEGADKTGDAKEVLPETGGEGKGKGEDETGRGQAKPEEAATDQTKTPEQEEEEAKVESLKQELEAIKKKSLFENMRDAFAWIVKKLGDTVNLLMGKAKLLETAEKFAKEEMDKMQIKPDENKDKQYETQDKSAEYVCSVLNLPVRQTPGKLLDTFQASNRVFEKDNGKIKDPEAGLEVGDVVFFRKAETPDRPYLCAWVNKIENEQIFIKTIPEGGGTPIEIALETSDYYKTQWLGYVKPKKEIKAEEPEQPATAEPPKT